MSTRLGIKAKVYYRSGGSYESPTLTEVKGFSDCAVNPQWDEGDANSRASRVKLMVKTMLGLELTGKVKADEDDASYVALRNAAVSDEQLDVFVLSGLKEEVGVWGWRFYAQVFQANEDQGLGVAIYDEFSIKPTPPTDGNYPVFVQVGGGGMSFTAPGDAVS